MVLERIGIYPVCSRFAGAVGVGVGFGPQNVACNFIKGSSFGGESDHIGDRVEVAAWRDSGLGPQHRYSTNDNIAMIA
jgi:hypothetical protein